MKIEYCRKCLNPSNHPLGIIFNENGICSGCIVHEEKYKIDWKKKFESLNKIFEKVKKKNSSYDCVIPINGNSDDFFTTHIAKNILKLRPLLVSYNNHFNTKVGIRNTARLISQLDCDHIGMTLNPKVTKIVTKKSFELINDIYWPVLAGNQAFPVQIALKLKIPVIFWGVNGWLDQVGKFSHDDNVEMTKKIWEEFSLRNLKFSNLIKKTNLKERDIAPLIYPNLKEIFDSNLRGIYLGNYILWDSKKQSELMINKYGYETISQERTYNKYESIYCQINAGTHDFIKLLKHGYGKVIDHLNRDIRFKRISRADAIYLAHKYQTIFPNDFDTFLKWLNITETFFFNKFNKTKNKQIIINKDRKISIKNYLFKNLKKKTEEEILKIEKKIGYQQTKNLEKNLSTDEFIIFGRTYMDEKNFKAEG